MKLRIINDTRTDPMLNIALEHSMHHLAADQKQEGILRFWKNEPAVIVGRLQQIAKEVNVEYCKANRIKVLRRISGGGTVFHDLGNINTTLILPIAKFPERDVGKMSGHIAKLMQQTLEGMGLENIWQEKNTNLFYGNYKISGSAGHLRKGWFMHHATLLLKTDLEMLNKSILARESNPEDPRSSRYFATVNLDRINEDQWLDEFAKKVTSSFDLDGIDDTLRDKELDYANKLVDELYSDQTWLETGKRKLVKPD